MRTNIQLRPTYSRLRGPTHSRVNPSFVSTIILLSLTPVANAITAVASGQPQSSSATSTTSSSPTSTSVALITPGTDCTNSEALFNCLTTSWQQCASGQWSIALKGEDGDGLACSPPGLSYDMEIVYANGTAAGTGTSGTGGAESTGTAGSDGSVAGAQGTANATTTATVPGSSGVGGEGQTSGASAFRIGGQARNVLWYGCWLGTLLIASAVL